MESPPVLRKVPGAFSSPVVTPRPHPGSRARRANLFVSPIASTASNRMADNTLSFGAVVTFFWALLTLLAFAIYSMFPLSALDDLLRSIATYFRTTCNDDTDKHIGHKYRPRKRVDQTAPPPLFDFARFGLQGSRLDFATGRNARNSSTPHRDIDAFKTAPDNEHRKHLLQEVLDQAKANGLTPPKLEWIALRFNAAYDTYTIFGDKERRSLQRELENDANSRGRLLETKEERAEREKELARIYAEEAEDEGYQSQDSVCSKLSYCCNCSRPHDNTFSPSAEVDNQINACIAERKGAEAAAAAAARAEVGRHRRQLSEDRKERKRLEEKKQRDDELRDLGAKTIQRRVLQRKLITLPPDNQINKIEAARKEHDDTTLCKPGKIPFSRYNLEKLMTTTGWLDDKAIMAFLNVVCDVVNERVGRSMEKKKIPKAVTIDSLVYSSWREAYSKRQDLAKIPSGLNRRANLKGDVTKIFEIETILIPVNSNNHWTLLVISPKMRKIEYIDSFRSSHRVPAMIARKFLASFLGPAYKDKDWVEVDTISPRQRNGYDCGVFVCTNGECIASGVSIDCYDENDMRTQRSRIAAVLLNEGFVDGLTPAIDL